ncbi:MAG: cobalt-precorrin-5B (C(1))-methyltransferase [Candidatus Binatia bacterium]
MAVDSDSEKRRGLRSGFTTGSCAAAAAKAATAALHTGGAQAVVDIALPNRQRVQFAVARTVESQSGVLCGVIKDAGDDPDVTHGAEICALVSLCSSGAGIVLEGGEGVGRVTKLGLGMSIGEPDITEVPRRMIVQAVGEALSGADTIGARVTITVPGGEELAKKTLLGRLGVVGGIGILGTSGIVKPYSTAAFRASISQAIDVAIAAGVDEVVFTTGGQSEKFAQRLLSLPEEAFVQMGDFVGFAMREAGRKKLRKATVVGMIGKLSKIADGKKMTHAAGSEVNMDMLAEMMRELGAPVTVVELVAQANTGRRALEIAVEHGFSHVADLVCKRAAHYCLSYAPRPLETVVVLTDFAGAPLGQSVVGGLHA